MRKFFLGALVLISTTNFCFAFNITQTLATSEKKAILTLTGPIDHGDDAKFQQTVISLLHQGYLIHQVYIFSHGGDVQAAMNIGNQIRTLQTTTFTAFNDWRGGPPICGVSQARNGRIVDAGETHGPDCTCESACFLIWAAGAQRFGTRVGIHRFFWKGSEFGNMSPSAARELYARNEAQYRAYVQKMNIPTQIVDRLFATGSQEVYYLTNDELRVLSRTPYLEEMEISRCGTAVANMTYSNGVAIFKPGFIECNQQIDDELHREGASAYLAGYPN